MNPAGPDLPADVLGEDHPDIGEKLGRGRRQRPRLHALRVELEDIDTGLHLEHLAEDIVDVADAHGDRLRMSGSEAAVAAGRLDREHLVSLPVGDRHLLEPPAPLEGREVLAQPLDVRGNRLVEPDSCRLRAREEVERRDPDVGADVDHHLRLCADPVVLAAEDLVDGDHVVLAVERWRHDAERRPDLAAIRIGPAGREVPPGAVEGMRVPPRHPGERLPVGRADRLARDEAERTVAEQAHPPPLRAA